MHGADGRGALLTGDTVAPGPSERWVTFLRSYPNAIPLSASTVERLAGRVAPLSFDRLYGSFGGIIPRDAHGVVRRSAHRYIAWVRGDFDDLT